MANISKVNKTSDKIMRHFSELNILLELFLLFASIPVSAKNNDIKIIIIKIIIAYFIRVFIDLLKMLKKSLLHFKGIVCVLTLKYCSFPW